MSFYKYKKRDAADNVNYNQLSGAFAKGAKELITSRQNQKDALEKNYQEFKKKTEEESPLGNHKGANEAMAAFSEDAAAKALEMQRRMRAGDIPVSARNAYMTNLKSTTTQMFELGNSFNENREELLARHESGGIGSAEELAYLEAAELFNGHGEPFIGDDGTVFLGARNTMTGELDLDNKVSLNKAKSMATQRVDKFDLTTGSAGVAEALDETYQLALRQGAIKTVDDARNNPEFNAALDAMIDNDLSDPSKVLSVLLDGGMTVNKGGVEREYEYTLTGWEGSDDQEEIIGAEYNEATGQFTPKVSLTQEKAAKEKYKNMILAQIGREETATEKTQEWEMDRGDAKKKFRSSVGMASKLYSGDEAEIQGAREYFLGLNKNIKDVTRTLDGVVVTYREKDGETVSNTVSFKDASGKFKSEGDFVRSLTELTGEGDLDDAIRRAGLNGSTPTKHSSTEGATRTVNKTLTPDVNYGKIEMDVEGEENLVSTDAAFDNINIDGEYGRLAAGDRQLITDGFETVVSGIMGNLTQGKGDGLIASKTDDESTMFEFYLPGAMTGPVFMSIEEGDEMMITNMKGLSRLVYEAANNGTQVSPNDLRSFIADKDYNRMSDIYELEGYEIEDWNGGDGNVQSSSGGGSETELPSNSSSRFNSGT